GWDYWGGGGVMGVIRGWGRPGIGTGGGRCGKARFLGLPVRPADPGCQPAGLGHHDVAEVLGSYYGVPCYRSLAELLAACPLTADYFPRRHRSLATSALLGPTTPSLPVLRLGRPVSRAGLVSAWLRNNQAR